jgi:hypothetical protein
VKAVPGVPAVCAPRAVVVVTPTLSNPQLTKRTHLLLTARDDVLDL